MSTVRESTYATLIGDVVESRRADSQKEMFRSLDDAHSWVNERVEAVQALRLTIGDEFQAVYRTVSSALEAALLLRLFLGGTYDLRFGIGWGEVLTTAPERAPSAQSGAGWWRAREAVEEVAELARGRHWPRSIRTRVRGLQNPLYAVVDALTLCQDHVLSKMDGKDCRLTIGMFEGERQSDLAEHLLISQSEVSRRQLENGPATLYRAYEALRESGA